MSRFAATLFLSLSFCTILLSGPAFAENRIGAFTLSPMAGYDVIDGGMDLDNAGIFGASAGYNIDAHWAIEGGVYYTPTKTDSNNSTDINIWTLNLGALYHFQPEKQLNPYLQIGGGGLIYDIDGTSHNDEDYMLYWGTGLKYAVTENVALRLDLRHILDYQSDKKFNREDDTNWRHQLQALAGLTFQFGGTSNFPVRQEAVMEPVTKVEEPAPVAVPMDGDKDGVVDSQDKCPGTGPGVRVDMNGCPADTDGDGVADHLDACVDTPAGTAVDEKGCPIMVEPIASMVLQLKYGVDKDCVTPFHYNQLDKAAAFIAQYPDAKIQLVGHTDSTGDADYNLALSKHRANNVRLALIERYGVAADRITAIGMGEKEPVASNDTDEGRSQNRRVEINILP